MRNRWAVVFVSAILPAGSAVTWQLALPGYEYSFPRDHFSHPNYRTEWWYYTGNLHAPDGHRFGFELTFFREGAHLPPQTADIASVWRPDQIYMAHLALSDIDGQEFYHTARMNRAGPGLAGAGFDDRRYWNGNWHARWVSTESGEQQLEAVCERFVLRLHLKASKPLVIHGQNGVSLRGSEPGEASHYVSYTRLRADGQLAWRGARIPVEGVAWMDHEFFSNELDKSLAGWDWFSIQLESGEELMLYRLRRKDGTRDAFSSGTFVDRAGVAHFLPASAFSLGGEDFWESAASHARYPIGWKISVPSLSLELTEQTALRNQELFSRDGITPSYWEGAVTYDGREGARPARGVGYLEMTGYDRALRFDR